MSGIVTISLLGGFGVTMDGAKLTVPGRKSQALLAYLAAKQGQDISREVLCGLIWGDRADEQARASLRQALAVLRKVFGEVADDLFATGNATVALRRGAARVDVTDFAAAMARDDLAGAAELAAGEFLAGLGAVDPAFDRWAEMERAALSAGLVRCLTALLGQGEAEGETVQVIATANRLLALDDLQEGVARSLMRAHMRQNDFNAALRQYEGLRERLDRELGVRPAPESEALAAGIRSARKSTAPMAPKSKQVGPLQDRLNRPSIAVLPFRALGANSEMVGEGVADEIIIELSRSSELSVVSRQSSFRFTSEKSEASEIGAALGVRFCLSGTAQTAGDRLRLTARLDRCTDGATVWAERFDRDLKDIFDVQTEIARIVTATVIGRIVESDTSASRLQRPGNLAAYDHVLRGIQLLSHHTHAEMDAARSHFGEAVKLDPAYARAYGLLAMAEIYMIWFFGPDDDLTAAVSPAHTAVRLDSREVKGHCALGIISLVAQDYGRARHHYETALSVNNNDDMLLVEYGRFLMYEGEPEQGIGFVREAMRLNPFHPSWYWNVTGRCLHSLGLHAEALTVFERIAEPSFWTRMYIASCQAMLGNNGIAAQLREQVLAVRPELRLAKIGALFPYKNSETRDRLFDSFRAAGFL